MKKTVLTATIFLLVVTTLFSFSFSAFGKSDYETPIITVTSSTKPSDPVTVTPTNTEPLNPVTVTPTETDPVNPGTVTPTNTEPVNPGTVTPTNTDPGNPGTVTPTNTEPGNPGKTTPTDSESDDAKEDKDNGSGVLGFLKKIFSAIGSFFKWLFSLFGGK